KDCSEFLDRLVPLAVIDLQTVFRAAITFFKGRFGVNQFDLAVLTAELFHLTHGRMCLEISLGALFQVAVNSLIVGIPVCYQTVRKCGSGQTLGDDKGIVTERIKQFLQYLWLSGLP